MTSTKIYSLSDIFILADSVKTTEYPINSFLQIYAGILDDDKIAPIFSKTTKYNLFPQTTKSYKYNKFKQHNNVIMIENNNSWKPLALKSEDEKQKTVIIGTLNKVCDGNLDVIIKELLDGIKECTSTDILYLLAERILTKIWYDKGFYNQYIMLCQKVWSMSSDWYDKLYSIVCNDDTKLFWYENKIRSNNESADLKGPYSVESLLKFDARCELNFKRIFVNNCQKEFNKISEYEAKMTEATDDEDEYKYRRRIMGTVEIISYLYKSGYINERIIHICLIKLLGYTENNLDQDNIEDDKSEDIKITSMGIEAFRAMWNIIGKTSISKHHGDQYHNFIKKKILPKEWNSRLQFMLEDIMAKYYSDNNTGNTDNTGNTNNNTESYIEDSNSEKLEEKQLESLNKLIDKTYNCDSKANKVIKYIDDNNLRGENVLDSVLNRVIDFNQNEIHCNIIIHLFNKKIITKNIFKTNLDLILNELDDLCIDVPKARYYVIEFARYISNNCEYISAEFINKSLNEHNEETI